MPRLLLLLLLLLLASISSSAASSAAIREDCAEEATSPPAPHASAAGSRAAGSRLRSSGIVRRPRLFCHTCWVYAVLTVLTSPLTRPSGVAAALRALRLPLGATLRRLLLGACAALYRLRERYTRCP